MEKSRGSKAIKPASRSRILHPNGKSETGVADELKDHFPDGNAILREDYQRSFKARTRFQDTKDFLKAYRVTLHSHVSCKRGDWSCV